MAIVDRVHIERRVMYSPRYCRVQLLALAFLCAAMVSPTRATGAPAFVELALSVETNRLSFFVRAGLSNQLPKA
jgi:hypothetical protein